MEEKGRYFFTFNKSNTLPWRSTSDVNSIPGSVVVSVTIVTISSSIYVSRVEVSGTNVVSVSVSSHAGVGGWGWSVVAAASGASVADGGGGIGNARPVVFGPASCTSSSPAVPVVVVIISTVVIGRVVGMGVVGGTVVACVSATVKLREGAAGGSVCLAVVFGGPKKKMHYKRCMRFYKLNEISDAIRTQVDRSHTCDGDMILGCGPEG